METGKNAWQLYQAKKPPIIVTDWLKPELDGITLCRKIRKTPGEHYTYIIMLTSKARPKAAIQAFDAGADDYIAKPIRVDHLVKALEDTGVEIRYNTELREIQGEERVRLAVLEDNQSEERHFDNYQKCPICEFVRRQFSN